MATETPSRSRAKTASSVIGLVIAGIAGAFVIRTLLRERDEIGDALEQVSPGWLVGAFVIAAIGMTGIALPWGRALRLLGADLPPGQVVARYFAGEIGKYVPGGVWPILGRGELARQHGVRRSAAYGSVALSLAALYLAALFVVVALLPALLAGGDGTGPIAIVLLLPVGLVALHPRVLGLLIRLVERAARRSIDLELPSWRDSAIQVALYVPAWLAIGTATWTVARGLDPHAELLPIGAAAVLSWVIGFILIPAPGGVGIREAAFVASAGSLDPGIAAATAVFARATFVVVDALGAAISAAALRRTADWVEPTTDELRLDPEAEALGLDAAHRPSQSPVSGAAAGDPNE